MYKNFSKSQNLKIFKLRTWIFSSWELLKLLKLSTVLRALEIFYVLSLKLFNFSAWKFSSFKILRYSGIYTVHYLLATHFQSGLWGSKCTLVFECYIKSTSSTKIQRTISKYCIGYEFIELLVNEMIIYKFVGTQKILGLLQGTSFPTYLWKFKDFHTFSH